MTNEEFAEAQAYLRLTEQECARMLGFEYVQHVQRLKKPPGDRYAKNVTAGTARLMRAYLDGYRPEDWPETARPAEDTVAKMIRDHQKRLEEANARLKAAVEEAKAIADEGQDYAKFILSMSPNVRSV